MRNKNVPRVYSSLSCSGDEGAWTLPATVVDVGTCEWRLLCVATRGEEGRGGRSCSSRLSASRRRRSERLGVGGRGAVVFVGDGGWYDWGVGWCKTMNGLVSVVGEVEVGVLGGAFNTKG